MGKVLGGGGGSGKALASKLKFGKMREIAISVQGSWCTLYMAYKLPQISEILNLL